MSSNPISDRARITERQGSETAADHADGGDAVVDQAYAMYDAKIRRLVEPDRRGEYLTIDVKTGQYEIDADALTANVRMLEGHTPDRLVTMRIGFPAFGTFVGWSDLMP